MQHGSESIPQGPTGRTALRLRFAAWIGVVLAVLAGPLWSMAGYPVADVVWNLAGVTIMLLLLRSTPLGAIRLAPALSWVMVFTGFLWLSVTHGPPGGFIILLALIVAIQAGRRPAGLVGASRSPWQAAPFFWHSILWLGLRSDSWLGPRSELKQTGEQVSYFSGLIAMVVATMCLDRPGHVAKMVGWTLWLAAGAATVVFVMGWPPPP